MRQSKGFSRIFCKRLRTCVIKSPNKIILRVVSLSSIHYVYLLTPSTFHLGLQPISAPAANGRACPPNAVPERPFPGRRVPVRYLCAATEQPTLARQAGRRWKSGDRKILGTRKALLRRNGGKCVQGRENRAWPAHCVVSGGSGPHAARLRAPETATNSGGLFSLAGIVFRPHPESCHRGVHLSKEKAVCSTTHECGPVCERSFWLLPT